MYFVGVDLAWSDNNPTGLAAIEYEDGEGKVVSTDIVDRDGEITGFIEDRVGGEDGIVCVDAPLLVPNETGRRVAEKLTGKLFKKYDAGAHPANRKRLGQWTGRVRGEEIVEKLGEIGFEHDPDIDEGEGCRKVVEVYPHPAMVVLFGLDEILKYKNRPGRDYGFLWKEFRRYQDNLEALEESEPRLGVSDSITEKNIEGTKGKELKRHEDILDAVFCAYIGLYYWKNPEDCAVLGNMEEGYIMTPVDENMKNKLRDIRSQRKLDSYDPV